MAAPLPTQPEAPVAQPIAVPPVTAVAPAEGRMALSGPRPEMHEPAPSHPPRLRAHAPEAQPQPEQPEAATATPPKFGPTVFREVERNGF